MKMEITTRSGSVYHIEQIDGKVHVWCPQRAFEAINPKIVRLAIGERFNFECNELDYLLRQEEESTMISTSPVVSITIE